MSSNIHRYPTRAQQQQRSDYHFTMLKRFGAKNHRARVGRLAALPTDKAKLREALDKAVAEHNAKRNP